MTFLLAKGPTYTEIIRKRGPVFLLPENVHWRSAAPQAFAESGEFGEDPRADVQPGISAVAPATGVINPAVISAKHSEEKKGFTLQTVVLYIYINIIMYNICMLYVVAKKLKKRSVSEWHMFSCLICLSRNPTMFIWSIAMKKTMNHILHG